VKLRFRDNSLRLRLNQKEVGLLASGTALREDIHFPGGAVLSYLLEPFSHAAAVASFAEGTIRIAAPGPAVRDWAESAAIGLYYKIPVESQSAPASSELRIAIEKDLECLDAPEEERDPDAFARVGDTTAAC
jgi:hypothetical protein